MQPAVAPAVRVRQLQARPSMQHPLPKATQTAQAYTDAVFALADTWREACRVAFHRAHWCPMFSSRTPWANDATQARRWKAFTKLYESLKSWGAPPAEFCTAVLQFYAKPSPTRKAQPPNPMQVTGEHGRQVWAWWKARHLRNGDQSQTWVQGQAAQGTVSDIAEVQAGLQQAYAQYQEYGLDEAPSIFWSPQVVWLLWATEPVTRPGLRAFFQTKPTEQEALRAYFQKVAGDPGKRTWLLRVREDLLGASAPTLTSPTQH